MKADKNNSTGRYRIIIGLMTLLGLYIMGTALRTMLPPQKEYWEEVSKRFTKANIPEPAARGNLLGCDGQILVGTLPRYRLLMDFRVADPDSTSKRRTEEWREEAYRTHFDSLAIGLARIFPDYSVKWFRERLEKGRKSKRFSYRIYPGYASYIQYQECLKLPILCESSLKSGFHVEEILQRHKPYGPLASRTLGDLYRDSDRAKCGLELSFDSILRGTPGSSHRTKLRSEWHKYIDQKPIDGHDLVTTIDINLQDMVDRTLRNKLMEPTVNGELGIAVVMEVKTGDIKAIANLTRAGDGQYYEMKNNAVSDLMEPGSTFKTASIMVALEDGKITKNTTVDTGSGIYNMHGSKMKDHNWNRGGYGVLDVSGVLEYSSNIGVSRLIDQAYHEDPDEFVRGLNREGVGRALHLPFVGAGEPWVRHPEKQGRYWKNWSKTALAWMSIGYETMLPPISTLTFYNAIANNGRMVKPRFVTAELEEGRVVREFPVEEIMPSICKPSTLADIQEILEKVVSKGLGKKAGNGGKYFRVSGKTGTAMIASGSGGGYRSGTPRYMVSFCGYFPSEAPKYSCIVCIVKRGLPASGGGQCGPVFSEISQYIMSKGMYRDAEEAADSTSVFVPNVAQSNAQQTRELAKELGLDIRDINECAADTVAMGIVPDVKGMGARDAVYEMQRRGLKVKLHGSGRVKEQNMPPGTHVVKGKTITLTLKE